MKKNPERLPLFPLISSITHSLPPSLFILPSLCLSFSLPPHHSLYPCPPPFRDFVFFFFLLLFRLSVTIIFSIYIYNIYIVSISLCVSLSLSFSRHVFRVQRLRFIHFQFAHTYIIYPLECWPRVHHTVATGRSTRLPVYGCRPVLRRHRIPTGNRV